MKEIACRKAGQLHVFRAETFGELMKSIYAAGEGPGAALSVVEAVILTDRLMVQEGQADPEDFSWTEDMKRGEQAKIAVFEPEKPE